MIIKYSVGEFEKTVVLEKKIKEEFEDYLARLVSAGLKLPVIAERTGLQLKKLRNIRYKQSSGNKEMLIKLFEAYHHILFKEESNIIPEKLEERVETLEEKVNRIEEENREMMMYLIKLQKSKLNNL